MSGVHSGPKKKTVPIGLFDGNESGLHHNLEEFNRGWDNSCCEIRDEHRRVIRARKDDTSRGNIRGKKYDNEVSTLIQGTYLIAVTVWILFVFLFGILDNMDPILFLLILIPPILFFIGYTNSCVITFDMEDLMSGANYLSFGFLITIILLNWKDPVDENGKARFFRLLIVGFILIMLSMLDVWVDRRWMSLVAHVRTVLQSSALIILSIALYMYYVNHRDAHIILSKMEAEGTKDSKETLDSKEKDIAGISK